MLSIVQIELWIKTFATQVPLEIFVFVGSLIEELIAPIPSPLVLTTAGALALVDNRTIVFLLWMSLIAAIGKNIGAWFFYVVGDKLEDVALKRYGAWLGIRHEDIENIGKRFGNNHWKDGTVLFLLRAAPFIPSIAVSFVAGVIKLEFRVYLVASFFGNFAKSFMYAYSGFAGGTLLNRLWQDAERIRLGMDILVIIAMVIVLLLMYSYREKGMRYLSRCIKRWSQGSSK